MPEFHRLETFDDAGYDDIPGIICSFKTDRFGYLQVRMTKNNDSWKFKTLPSEPDLNMFTTSDVNELKAKTRLIWRMVYDTPAAKERFE